MFRIIIIKEIQCNSAKKLTIIDSQFIKTVKKKPSSKVYFRLKLSEFIIKKLK